MNASQRWDAIVNQELEKIMKTKKTNKMLLAAGFVLAGVTAVNAESAFEPTNAVPNGLTNKSERILQLTATPAGVDLRTERSAQRSNSTIHKTRNSGFAHGYSTFEVLDSIR